VIPLPPGKYELHWPSFVEALDLRKDGTCRCAGLEPYGYVFTGRWSQPCPGVLDLRLSDYVLVYRFDCRSSTMLAIFNDTSVVTHAVRLVRIK
jgi:hypothetical protein